MNLTTSAKLIELKTLNRKNQFAISLLRSTLRDLFLELHKAIRCLVKPHAGYSSSFINSIVVQPEKCSAFLLQKRMLLCNMVIFVVAVVASWPANPPFIIYQTFQR